MASNTTSNKDADPPRQKAITALEPALHILERFHHRNKNQHRLSKWWSQADMLRRHLRRFIESLYDGLEDEKKSVARAARGGVSATKKKKGSKTGKVGKLEDMMSSGGGCGFVKDEFGIYERGAHMRGVLVPRAYLAFTQLTADRQFAHLGLMLLAILAQVDHAVAPFAPGPGATDEGVNDEPEVLSGSFAISTDQADGKERKDKPIINITTMDQQQSTGEDIGVAISRDEFLASSGQTKTVVESKKRQTVTIDVDMEVDIDTPKQTAKFTKKVVRLDLEEHEDNTGEMTTITKKKKRTREEDQEQSIVDVEKKTKVSSTKVTTETTSSSSTTTTTKEKRKKSKKAGDEFDDIFGGLL